MLKKGGGKVFFYDPLHGKLHNIPKTKAPTATPLFIYIGQFGLILMTSRCFTVKSALSFEISGLASDVMSLHVLAAVLRKQFHNHRVFLW